MNEKMKDSRVEYIDVAKGIGILLVVFGHVVYGGNYKMFGYETISNFIYSFHMPLFFIISGLCIRDDKQLNKSTIQKMVKAYIIPYLVWTILYMLLFWMIEFFRGYNTDMEYLIAHATSICGLAPLWFLLALFISEIVLLGLKSRIFKKGGYSRIFIFLFVFSIITSIWYESTKENMDLYLKNWVMGLFRILPTTFFVLFGYRGRCFLSRIKEGKIGLRLLLIFVMSIMQIVLCLYWNDHIDVQLFILANPLLYFIKAVNGAMVVLLMAQMMHSKIFYFLGSRTKELMILHYPPFYYTVILRTILGKFFKPNIAGGIIITVVTIVCCIAIDQVMERFRIWRVTMGRQL